MNWTSAVLADAEIVVAAAPQDSSDGAESIDRHRDRPPAQGLHQLFLEARAELQRYFVRRLGNRELAAEHTQDTFLRFARMRYRPEGSEGRQLLFAIARNLFLDYLRRRRRMAAAGFDDSNRVDVETLDAIAARSSEPEQQLMASQELTTVLAALEQLPLRSRQVFMMHRLQGQAHKDIARQLGITRSMVEKHIMEATARLVKALDSAGDN